MYPNKDNLGKKYVPSDASYYKNRGSSYSSSTNLSSKYSERIFSRGGIFVSSRSHWDVKPSNWHLLPEDILLCVFQQLTLTDLLAASRVCRHWNGVAFSDYLWMKFFQQYYHQDPSIPLSPRAEGGWRGEFERLVDRAPIMLCEVLKQHRSAVLHVAFSNDGDLFATCSADAQVIVWSADYPAELVFEANLQRKYNWKFATFSQFNATDTLLLVSGAYVGLGPFPTAGEVVIFDLEDDFRLLSRSKNCPHDLFGCWITDDYLVTGELKWLQNMHSVSTLLLTRSTQEISSEHVPILTTLLKLFGSNSACARSLMVAQASGARPLKEARTACGVVTDGTCIHYTPRYYQVVLEAARLKPPSSTDDCSDPDRPPTPPQSLDNADEKLLLFTTGDRTYTPHQIGVITLTPVMPQRVEVEHDIAELLRRRERLRQRVLDHPGINMADYEKVRQLCHAIDHTIEMEGSVVGMALSPDHRFLYISSRAWACSEHQTVNPITAPPVTAHVNLHVFDLHTLEEVGRLVQHTEAVIPSDESYYTSPSVSHHYVASSDGARCAVLWDRHYGVRLAEMRHQDILSCVALSAARPDVLVTVSDSSSVKVWRSRRTARASRIFRATEAKIMAGPHWDNT